MGLREIELKPAYDSSEDDIINSFYIPTLSSSIRYRRLAGFFSSSSLAVAARGISQFVTNGGRMKLIVSAKLRKQDVDAISKGISEPEKIITELALMDFESMENEFVKDHVRALAWMIANKFLEIKIAIPLDNGLPLEEEVIRQRGIFHQKVGILEDADGNAISFSGSVNESAFGWLHNIEEFKVFRSWIEGETPHLKSDYEKFERYWYGTAKNMMIIDVPTAIKEKLVQLAPESFGEIQLKIDKWKQSEKIGLRDYQQNAVEEWLKFEKGIIEMATGTGKTFTAIACAKEIEKKEKKLAVVITCPFIHLVDQWIENLHTMGHTGLKAFGSSSSWEDKLMNQIYDLNNGYGKILFIVTTHDTFASDKFTNIISKIKLPLMLIADEVHGLGSPERRKGLLELYRYRIGLSATPSRWFDEEGTDLLFGFFGNTVFQFTLKDAIGKYLTPYEYYPHFVELEPEELEEYNSYSKKIARQFFSKTNHGEEKKGLEMLLIQRQRIIVNAKNKMAEFEQILNSINTLTQCLIYCSPNQIQEVQDRLNLRGVIQHKFTAHEDSRERKEILDSFASGNYQALVAMKCLDEGVDVPSTQMAIILASSGNPREFIQRRGRILRKFPGKEKAIIHDIIVIPSFSPTFDEAVLQNERKILQKELGRVHEFANSSSNPVYTINNIYPILNNYKISLEEIIS